MLNDMSFEFAPNWFHELNFTWILNWESVVIGFRLRFNLGRMDENLAKTLFAALIVL